MDNHLKIDKDFSQILSFIKKVSNECASLECCFLIGTRNDNFCAKVVVNRSPQPHDFFHIDPLDYLSFKSEWDLFLIAHSHPNADCSFSELDIASSEASCCPFLLYCLPLNKFAIYVPKSNEIDVNTLNKVQGLI